MSFPTTPTNGQLTVVNYISYQWSAASGSWTRLSGQITSTNYLSVLNTTSSTNTTTGALTVAGGVGVGGNLNIGGTATINGNYAVTTASFIGQVGVSVAAAGTNVYVGVIPGAQGLTADFGLINDPVGAITYDFGSF